MGGNDNEVTAQDAREDTGRGAVERRGDRLPEGVSYDDIDEFIWHRKSSYETWEEISAQLKAKLGVDMHVRTCAYRYNLFLTKITSISPEEKERYRALMIDRLENLGRVYYQAIDPLYPDEKLARVVIKTIETTARLVNVYEDDIRDRNVQNVAILVSSERDAFIADLKKAQQAGVVVDDGEDEEDIL